MEKGRGLGEDMGALVTGANLVQCFKMGRGQHIYIHTRIILKIVGIYDF